VVHVSGGNDLHYLNQPEQRNAHDLYTKRRATRDQAYRGPTQGADVMPGYFDALGVSILEGRDFSEADTWARQGVMIINQHAAETLFPGESAVGQQIRWGNNDEFDPWMTVIGVVENTKWHPAERTPGFETYWSYRQYSSPTIHYLIRTASDPSGLLPAVRQTIQQLNPDLAVQRIEPMTSIAANSLWQRRLWGLLLGVFAGLALTLAAIGLYGVMSYLVTLQTREIGIRMAIGAPAARVMSLILSKGMTLVAMGGAIGLLCAAGAARLLASLLYDLSAGDPLTYVAVAAVLGAVAFVACWLPARRASRVDPLVALRSE
jgi:putative ABC transport system permease protein